MFKKCRELIFFATTFVTCILSSSSASAQADFNRDLNTDILWRHSNGQVHAWLMNGTQVFNRLDLESPGLEWQIQGTGDFNRDGNTDILWRHSNGQVHAWLMNGTQVFNRLDLESPGLEWQIQGTGDFNRDGNTDILWRHSNGQVHAWLMNGTQVFNRVDLESPGLEWQIQGTGDFNRDGNTDILWRHRNGQVHSWLMTGTQVFDRVDLESPGLEWQIQGKNGYYSDLFLLIDNDWNYQSRDNLFFDGKTENGESLASVKQVYSDLSNGIFGSYKRMTAGYFDTTNYSGTHYGIDMAGLASDTVKTVVSGNTRIIQSTPGNFFIGIEGDDGNLWIYGHLENYSVGIGQRVEAGTIIGTVFDGAYLGSYWMPQHLHLEVHKGHTYDRTKTMSPLQAYWKLRNR
ncbi:VCBS repeat-containing protein [Nodularia sp. LEGE 06071]|uniref:FG-GAP-like repeat-containing protein n=1 Tax=Nodularia sp. LEGE 06071 TaxID=2777965 RepID=UPI00187EA9A1|nr:FG-GAP-like repeat-containing protein [Nodularia sp. LEGE 06071]MBE9198132.1 VCBS repeat-containing protein [Nodularia sp. LEGE 06071]